MRGPTPDIYDIRRRNLSLLIDEHADGNLTRFVEVALDGLTSYKGLQQVTGSGRKRNLGSAQARKIEAHLQLAPGGWITIIPA